MLPGGRLELALREARHLFQAHFTAKLGHRVNDDQAAHALLQLAHVGLFFFGDGTTEREFRQLLRSVGRMCGEVLKAVGRIIGRWALCIPDCRNKKTPKTLLPSIGGNARSRR